MVRRSSLKEYQDEILRKMDIARQSSGEIAEQVRYFGFFSAGKRFLIDSSRVVEMTAPAKLQPIPMAKPWAVGAANVKGSVYSVTDFGILFSNIVTKSGKFIILDDSLIAGSALLIDDLIGIYDRSEVGSLVSAGDASEMPDWISGGYLFNNEIHHMISLEKLIEDERFTKLQSGD